MTYNLILSLTTLISSFFLSFFGLYYCTNKNSDLYSQRKAKELNFLPIYLTNFLIISILYFLTSTEEDAIYKVNATEIYIPLILGGICYSLSYLKIKTLYINLSLILAVTISSFLLPQEFLFFQGYFPFWIDRLIIIACWSIFSCFYYIFNNTEGMLGSFSLSFVALLPILVLLDGAPLFYGLVSLSFLGTNSNIIIFNWFPAKIYFTDNSSKIFGFLIGWLMVISCKENLAPCFLILLSIFAIELAKSLIQKLLLRDKYNNLKMNTTFSQANISGLTAEQVCTSSIKIQIILVILSCFQLYVPNTYSLPVVSLFLSAWFLNKLQHWNEPEQNLREINQEFIANVRQNITEIKDKLDKD